MFKKSLLSLMLLCFAFFGVARAQSELTVYEGTATSNVVPAYIFYFDDFTRSQHVIPAEDLTVMNGATITSLKYYTTASNVPYTAVSSAKVYLMEVDYTTMTALEPMESGEVVFEGYFDVVSEGEGGSLTIEFDTPYTYDGGNLLVGIENTEDVNFKNISFYGTTVEGAAWGGSNGTSLENVTGTQRNFIPQTTFTYTPGSGQACDKPENLAAVEITAHSAFLTWDSSGGGASEGGASGPGSQGYNVELKGGQYADWTRLATNMGTNLRLNGLTHNTTYQARVQTVCDDGVELPKVIVGVSGWRTISFTTENACPDPTDLTVSLTPGDGTVAELTWIENGTAEIWQICINEDEDNLIEVYGSESTPGQTLTFQFSDLTPDMTYTAKVRASCGDIDQSGWSNTVTFTPTDDYVVTVNDGTNTNGFVPIYGYWCDNTTKSQFIIPADDLQDMAYGTINKMTFYGTMTGNHPDWGSATFEVYMTETSETTLSELVDYNNMQKVMNSASLSIVNGQMVVVFDSPFEYMGDNLMVGFLQTASGQYSSCSWTGVTSEGASMGGYGTNISQQNFLPKTTFGYTPGETPDCPKPLYLAVNYTGGTEATISWNGDAESWNLNIYRVGATAANIIENVSNPYTVTNLELATTYQVAVQANCGDNGESEWTNPVSFKTDACLTEDQCALTFTLTDAYGDGWNGASIDIYDYTGEELGDLLASITNQDLDGLGNYTEETQTITVNFCNGQELAIIWTSGQYDVECTYTITDLNGDVVVEGEGAGFDGFAYTMDCTVTDCRRPTDFAASEIGGRSVVLSWTENGPATEWEIAYVSENDTVVNYITVNTNPYTLTGLTPETMYVAQVTPVCEVDKPSDVISWTTDVACPKPTNLSVTAYPTSADVAWNGFADAYDLEWAVLPATGTRDPYNDENWYYYDNGTYVGSVGLGGGEFHWGIMFPAGTYEGNLVSKVKAYDINAMVGTLAIYNDGETAPANQISIQDVEFTGAGDWVEFDTYANIDPTKNVWIVFDAVDGAAYPIGTSNDDNGDANGRWVEISGAWYDMANVGVTGRANMLRAYIESGANLDELDWNLVSGITSPYTITGLDPETKYIVRVKALCGDEDGESDWTMTTFTTPSLCDVPFNLNVSDIFADTATLNWTGYQNRYNLRYRQPMEIAPATPVTIILEAHDVWGDGSGYQLLLDADATAYGTIIPETGALTEAGDVSDTIYAEFEYKIPVDADGVLTTENIVFDGFVTIEIPAGTYDWCITNPTPEDRMWIAADNGIVPGRYDDFVFEPGLTYYFTIGNYGGGDGVALEIIRPMGEWTSVTVNGDSYTLPGLSLGTTYEWQVQGINRSCNNSEGENGVTEWSGINTFVSSNGLIFIADGNWNDAANWYIGEVPEGYSDVTIAANAIIPTDYDARVNNITYIEGGSLTIQDGGQLHSNVNVDATLEKNINGYGQGQGNWHLITNPLWDKDIMPDTTALTSGEYDLYEFWTNYTDNEWLNYKNEENGGFYLGFGQGYLYAKAQDTTLSFTGNMGREYTNFLFDDMMLFFGDTTNTNGNWNLKGNLSPYTAYAYVGTLNDGFVELAEEQFFYKLNEEGTELVASDNIVKPGEGIFVRATGDGQYVFFSSVEHELNTDAKGRLNIAVTKISDSNTVSLPSSGKEKSLVNKQRKTNNTTIDLKTLKKTLKVKGKKACNKEVRNEWPIKLTAKKIR